MTMSQSSAWQWELLTSIRSSTCSHACSFVRTLFLSVLLLWVWFERCPEFAPAVEFSKYGELQHRERPCQRQPLGVLTQLASPRHMHSRDSVARIGPAGVRLRCSRVLIGCLFWFGRQW